MSWARRLAGGLLALVLGVNLSFWAIIAFATPFFSHVKTAEGLSFYGAVPHDPIEAEERLRTAAKLLAQSPLGAPERGYRAFTTNGDWRGKLFFAPAPEAGGVAYYPFSRRNVFLSGADLGADALIKDGTLITPPRTLTYYLVHEFTHLRIGELTGPVEYHRLPKWIMEGMCDFVALGPMSEAEIKRVTRWAESPLARMQAYGSYPVARAAVSFAQAHLGIAPKELISNQMSWDEIASHMRGAGYGGVTQWR